MEEGSSVVPYGISRVKYLAADRYKGIKRFLPSIFKSAVVEYNKFDDCNFTAVVRAGVHDLQGIATWIRKYGENSSTKWIVRTSSPNPTRKSQCKKMFYCHRSSCNKGKEWSPSIKSRNCNCSAQVSITIKRTTQGTTLRDKYIREGLPAVIRIRHVHNHAVIPHDYPDAWSPANEIEFLSASPDIITFSEATQNMQILPTRTDNKPIICKLETASEENMPDEELLESETIAYYDLKDTDMVEQYIREFRKCHVKFGTPKEYLQRILNNIKNVETSDDWEAFLYDLTVVNDYQAATQSSNPQIITIEYNEQH